MGNLTSERMLSIAAALEAAVPPSLEQIRWLFQQAAKFQTCEQRAREHIELAGWLQEVITRTAQDLEQLANAKECSAEAKAVLLRRATLLRRQAHERPPNGWTGQGSAGSDQGDEQ